MNLTIDKEFQSLIPPLASEELALLEISLKENGCLDSVKAWNGVIVDGHNRHRICTRENIGFKVEPMDFATRDAAKLWIIDNQMGRRNIADIDRIGLARHREEIVRGQAKENQVVRKGNQAGSSLAKLPKLNSIDTRKILAKSAGVGDRTYDAGVEILEAHDKGEVSDSELESIRRKEKSIHRVAKDLKEKRQAKERKTKRTAAASRIETLDTRIIVGDFRKHAEKVADGSLSLIFTDPPYDQKAIPMIESLADFAFYKLADGGSLLCYVGHLQLTAALNALGKRLRYWWTVCCLHSGGNQLMREYGIRVGWKPILWFVKGTRHDKESIVLDVISGGKEKADHEWQQSQSEAEYWIDQLTEEGDLVCDPFLGSGTTIAAAKKLNREWIGFEIDPATAAIAAEKIA